MHESFPQPKIEKEQLLVAHKKLIEKGITHPFGTDTNDPDVAAANAMFDTWMKEGDEAAKGDPEKEARFNFEKTFFYLDAGFTDRNFAEDILADQAQQDYAEVKEAYPELAAEIKAKTEKYAKELGIELPEDEEEK